MIRGQSWVAHHSEDWRQVIYRRLRFEPLVPNSEDAWRFRFRRREERMVDIDSGIDDADDILPVRPVNVSLIESDLGGSDVGTLTSSVSAAA
jgi:hypothetical protein